MRNLEREQKKTVSPVTPFFFLLSFQLSRLTRAKTLAMQASSAFMVFMLLIQLLISIVSFPLTVKYQEIERIVNLVFK